MNPKRTRRDFLRAAGFAAVSGSTLGALGTLQRATAAALSTDGNPTDYRALVCVMLDGGADSYNMLLPRSPGTANPATDYNTYVASRTNMAVGYDEQTRAGDPSSILSLDGSEMGMHPMLPGMRSLFNQGQLAAAVNVGPMIVPVTKTALESTPLPPQLFSHSDQFLQWQRAQADSRINRGWFGRAADLLSVLNDSPSPSMNISVVGSNLIQVGDSVQPYAIGTEGPIGIQTGWDPDGDKLATVEALMATADNLLGREYAAVKRRAQDNFDAIDGALGTLGDDAALFGTEVASQFPEENYFFDQLRSVARMIAIRDQLGARRQTFVVSLGPWDTHDNQLQDMPLLLQALDQGLASFQRALGSLGVEDSVTTFTQTEFSRTLNSNGTGTDHGWGGHQFVLGGAVRGGQLFGALPNLTLDGPDDMDRGRIIPTLAVDQYAATLARWFGVAEGDLDTVFPNLRNFDTRDLGFMG